MVCALADSALPLPNRALVVAALNAFLLPTQDAVEVPASTESYQARLACPCHADNPDHQKMQALPYASGATTTWTAAKPGLAAQQQQTGHASDISFGVPSLAEIAKKARTAPALRATTRQHNAQPTAGPVEQVALKRCSSAALKKMSHRESPDAETCCLQAMARIQLLMDAGVLSHLLTIVAPMQPTAGVLPPGGRLSDPKLIESCEAAI